MELRANITKEYNLYNSFCYKGKRQDEETYFYPTEAELISIYNNLEHRKILRQQLSQDLHNSLLFHMLQMDGDVLTTPFWQHTILNYRQAVQSSHAETDKWILNLKVNIDILDKIQQIQSRVRECVHQLDSTDVLCLGASVVVGLPELQLENSNINICCIESDEKLIEDLTTIYGGQPCIRKLVHGQFQHYYPDRKYDVIVYPAGQTWQETEKMQTLLLRLKTNLKPGKGRMLAY